DGWHIGVLRMRDQRNATCPVTRVFLGTGNLLAEFRRELAIDGGDVDADLSKDAALHYRHDDTDAAAFILLRLRTDEAARLAVGKRALQFIFKLFEACADAVTQFLEPALCRLLFVFDICRDDCWNVVALHVCFLPARFAGSPGTIAQPRVN